MHTQVADLPARVAVGSKADEDDGRLLEPLLAEGDIQNRQQQCRISPKLA